MGNIVSSKKKPKGRITTYDRVILDLKLQRDKLKQYQNKIQIVIDKEVEIAKHLLKNENNKFKALLILKKKKYQEKLIEQIDAQLLNLEKQVSSIEFALIEADVLEGLNQGNKILAKIHKEMSIQDVEKLIQETSDAIAYQNEVSNMLSGQFNQEEENAILEELSMFSIIKLPEVSSEMPKKEMSNQIPLNQASYSSKEDVTTNISTAKKSQLEKAT